MKHKSFCGHGAPINNNTYGVRICLWCGASEMYRTITSNASAAQENAVSHKKEECRA